MIKKPALNRFRVILLSAFALVVFSASLIAPPPSHGQPPTAQDSPVIELSQSSWHYTLEQKVEDRTQELSEKPEFVISRTIQRPKVSETLSYGAFMEDRLASWIITSPLISQVWDVEFIYTCPDWCSRGYASTLANTYAIEILKRGKIPYYSAPANEASRRAASRAGFTVCRVRILSFRVKFLVLLRIKPHNILWY